MRKNLLVVLLVFCSDISFSQISVRSGGLFYAKEFSKEIALYNAKVFVMNEVLGSSVDVIKFEIDPLAASNSGELTTLVYKCIDKNKSGLILGFYGNRWNDAGVSFQAYAFKNLPINEANLLLEKIENLTKANYAYLKDDQDNNNIFFEFQDLTILVYSTPMVTKLRIFWKDFDAEWEWNTFKKTKDRLAKKLKK